MRCYEPFLPLKLKAILFLLLFLPLVSFASQITITLKDVAFVNSNDVYLKDIANINTKSPSLKKYLAEIKLTTIYRNKTIIASKLVQQRLVENLIDIKKVKIIGDKTIVVLNKKQITAQELIPVITRYIKKHYKNIRIKKITVSPEKVDVIGNYSIKITPKGKTSSYIYLSIKLVPTDRELSASVRYVKLTKAVVAKHFLPKGLRITPLDVKISQVEVKPNKEYIKDLNDVLGKKLRRNIKEGEPITYRDLLKNYLVRRNSNVKVIYQRGAFKIELLGRALQNGELGDIIKVRNLSSGKVIQCKVIGINKVLFLSGQF